MIKLIDTKPFVYTFGIDTLPIHNFTRISDEWIHSVLVTCKDEADQVFFTFSSKEQYPSIKKIFDTLFAPRHINPHVRSALKGKTVRGVRIITSQPVTAYKVYVERKLNKDELSY